LRYPADPPSVEEVIRVMRAAGDGPVADRLRGMIVVLWRSGLRVSEALALSESDLDRGRGAILVRRGKGGKRREVGMDAWGWQQLEPWLQNREQLRVPRFKQRLDAASRRTSYATLTLLRWPVRASRSW
jgi:integrase